MRKRNHLNAKILKQVNTSLQIPKFYSGGIFVIVLAFEFRIHVTFFTSSPIGTLIMSATNAATLKAGDVVIPTCLKGFPSISTPNMVIKVSILDFSNGENTNVRLAISSLISVNSDINLKFEFKDTIFRYISKISLYFKSRNRSDGGLRLTPE
jgi:hypothetical protein